MEFKKYKLGDVAEILNGATPSTLHEEYYGGDIPWFTPKDLSDQGSKYVEFGERGLTQAGVDSCSASRIPPNNILMSSRAPIGLLAINKYACYTNQGFKSIIPNLSMIDVEYLYYYLKCKVREIESLGGGTTFKEVSKKTLERYTISLPPLEEQKKIAGTLALIDRKIELCEAQNRTLEKLARQIYDYWFVQFDFPNADDKPYKSSGGKMVYNEKLKREIPDGWEVKNVGMLCSIVTGKEDANFSTPDGQYPFFTCSNSVLRCDKADFEGNAILLSGNGDFSVKHFRGKFNAYQRTYVLSPYEEKHYAVTYLGTEMAIRGFKKQSSGSIIKFITKGDVEKIPLFDEPFLDEIYVLLNELLFKIEESTAQIQTLTSLRERLLPLLMNGQVQVSD